MSAPTRWANSGSEVDPVLRSVMRYAQSQSPTPAALALVLERVQAAREIPSSGGAPQSRGKLIGAFRSGAMRTLLRVAAVMVVGVGLAWAGYGILAPDPADTAVNRSPSVSEPRGAVGSVVPSEPRGAVGSVVPGEPRGVIAGPGSSARSAEPNPSASSRAQTLGGARIPVAAPELSQFVDDEVAVLQEARRLVASNPSAALALSRDHAARHPRSRFREEREALVVESLVRLGRSAEAKSRFRSFERSYPRSAYRRRLGAALDGAGATGE